MKNVALPGFVASALVIFLLFGGLAPLGLVLADPAPSVDIEGRIAEIKGNAPALVKAAVQRKLPNTPIRALSLTPIAGLYEMHAGDKLIYVNADATYLVFGHIYDLSERKDITQARKDALMPQAEGSAATVNMTTLPMDAAVSWGDPDGTPLVVFSDPECPWCRRLHATLKTLDGVRVQEIMYPIAALHPSAVKKARQILCSEIPHEALDEAMLDNPLQGDGDCESAEAVERAVAFGREHGFRGTPLMIRRDGKVLVGARDGTVIRKWLEEAPAETAAAD